jgi:hypothetical protein
MICVCATDSRGHHQMIRSVPLVSIKIETKNIKGLTPFGHRKVSAGSEAIIEKKMILNRCVVCPHANAARELRLASTRPPVEVRFNRKVRQCKSRMNPLAKQTTICQLEGILFQRACATSIRFICRICDQARIMTEGPILHLN